MSADAGQLEGAPLGDLEALIRKRKSALQQKARDKQQLDLNRIALLNWTDPDGVHPLQLLPKEMWLEILNHLRDPHDLENASFCCTFFTELLEPRRFSDILLPLALEVKTFRDELRVNDLNIGLLPLRLICKGVRDQVDKYIDDFNYNCNWLNAPCIKYPVEKDAYREIRATLALFDPNCVNRALRLLYKTWHFEVSLRDLNFTEAPGMPMIEHRNAFFKLLKAALNLVGVQLNKLDFRMHLSFNVLDGNDNTSIIAETYMLIHDLVSMTPNLRCLCLCVTASDSMEPEPSFPALLQSKPFPALVNLAELEIVVTDVTQAMDIYESVLRSNPQLKKVSLTVPESDLPQEFVSSLKSLALESLSLIIGYADSDLLENLISPRPNWRLKDVSIRLSQCTVSARQIFRFVEQFEELESLSLDFEDAFIQDSQGLPALKKLPRLSVFKFEYLFDDVEKGIEELIEEGGFDEMEESDPMQLVINDFTLSLDYLLLADRLEEIRWRNELAPPQTETETTDGGSELQLAPNRKDVIQFDGGNADLYESNVWKIFPSLKKVEVMNGKGRDLQVYVYRKGDFY